MPQKAWCAKRERRYPPIKQNLLGSSKPLPLSLAEEIAVRVLNKDPAQLEQDLTR